MLRPLPRTNHKREEEERQRKEEEERKEEEKKRREQRDKEEAEKNKVIRTQDYLVGDGGASWRSKAKLRFVNCRFATLICSEQLNRAWILQIQPSSPTPTKEATGAIDAVIGGVIVTAMLATTSVAIGGETEEVMIEEATEETERVIEMEIKAGGWGKIEIATEGTEEKETEKGIETETRNGTEK